MATTNYYTTNQPQDSFLLETQGYVQGVPLDDPTSRLWLAQGLLTSSASIPMWGGLPIEEMINVTSSGADGIGPTVELATSQATCTGFSTFAQMMHMIITPGATVPLAAASNSVGFFRLGTNVRLPVRCDPAIVTALVDSDGSISSQTLYWDTTNYQITLAPSDNWALPTSIRLLSINTNSKIATYSSGAVTWSTGDAAILLL